MKKEIVALILLIALFSASLLNISYLHKFTDSLCSLVESSREACSAGSFEKADVLLRSAMDDWKSAEGYTHIFIRHSEIDATTDAFCELLSDIASGDGDAASGGFEKLLFHLQSLYTMERVTPGSVF